MLEPGTQISVRSNLTFELPERSELVVQLAVTGTGERVAEELLTEGAEAVVEFVDAGDGRANRAHHVQAGTGRLSIDYSATVRVPPSHAVDPTTVERLVGLRQSRYCPSDLIEGFAAHELGHLRDETDGGRRVGSWVHDRLSYETGSSRPTDTALDTLLLGKGVCRDYAHLTVMLCRALGIPARFVAVYAPGLSPMDFHAVAEIAGPDGWETVDATRLAPRGSLVRIATGRDAADTALVTTLSGHAELVESSVWSTVDGDLPSDDHEEPVHLA